MGISQSILSACQEENLNITVKRLGIKKYFKKNNWFE